jgi:ParB family chromosome partitioning protein
MELIAGELTVRQAEQRSPKKRKAGGKLPRDPNIVDLEANISNRLGLKVQFTHNGDNGGEIRIRYKTLEQLEDVERRLIRS